MKFTLSTNQKEKIIRLLSEEKHLKKFKHESFKPEFFVRVLSGNLRGVKDEKKPRRTPLSEAEKLKLEEIKKTANKLNELLTDVYESESPSISFLKERWFPQAHTFFYGDIDAPRNSIHLVKGIAENILEGQKATTEGKHFLSLEPNYRGTRRHSDEDLAKMWCLTATCRSVIPSVKPTESQKETALFYQLALIVLENDAERKDIRRLIGKFARKKKRTI